jgi:hypothetical protein
MDEVCPYSLYSINARLSSVFVGYGLIRVERHAVGRYSDFTRECKIEKRGFC